MYSTWLLTYTLLVSNVCYPFDSRWSLLLLLLYINRHNKNHNHNVKRSGDLNYDFCAIQENFLETKSQKITQYSFCYKAIYNEEIAEETFACLDNDYQYFYWIDIDKLDNLKILPKSNKDLILGNNKDIHIIERN